jgi:hypothetical protein
MLSVIPHRQKSTPISAVSGALPDIHIPHMPRKNGHGHTRAFAVASAVAGLAGGTVAGALLRTHRKPAPDGGEAQAADGAEE